MDLERHTRTQAKTTTTPLAATPRPAPSVQQVLDGQQAADASRAALVARSPAAPLPSQMLSGPRSDEAFARHMDSLGYGGNPRLSPNLMEGDFRVGDDVVDLKDPAIFHCDEARKAVGRWNGEGNPRTVISVNMYEDAELPSREELPDRDPSQWEIDKYSGLRADPWTPEVAVPIVSTAPDGAIYELTSRSPTALFAIRGLLDRYHRHPQRKKGLVPLVQMKIGTYRNNKLGRDMYKPIYTIVGWVQKDGSAPASKPDPVSSGGSPKQLDVFKDEVPFK